MTKVKKNKAALWVASLCAFGLIMGLVACAPQNNAGTETTDQKADENQLNMPEQDEYGVILAESWKELYPDQYASYLENETNSPDSGKHNYLELYPALNTMYKGYAFALGYDEASSHLYTLQSVSETPRTTQKEQSANCITCKTPQFTAKVNSEGDGVYAQKFNDMIGEFTEPISCYNCHENTPSSLTVGNKFFLASMGPDVESTKAPVEAQVCGQCHNEYYFAAETKVTSNPYEGLAAMTPEAILAYYDDMGFKDWEHPETGAAMIKVQHPEFETLYGGDQAIMVKNKYNCADCHMGQAEGETGQYTSHSWTSPLENDELIKNDCSKCHDDLKGEVAAIQAAEEERVTAISVKIEDMINKIAAQKESMDADKLAQLQKLHRTAQFYWDFIMVENSEGAHNPDLTEETLDKAEAAVDEGLALLA